MEKEMENYDGDSNRNDEDVEKGQVEGGGRDCGVGNGTSDMELEQEQLPELIPDTAGAAGVAVGHALPGRHPGRRGVRARQVAGPDDARHDGRPVRAPQASRL